MKEKDAKVSFNGYRKNLDEELAEYSTERHDLYTFETKVDYHIHSNSEKEEFDISVYFFIPKSLQINNKTYPKEKFFADLTNHIRFKTPRMAIKGINDGQNQLSPIFRISESIENIRNGEVSEEIIEYLSFELKILSCICQTTLRDQIKYFISRLESNEDSDLVFEDFSNYLEDIKMLQNKIKKLELDFRFVQIPERLRESFKFANEFISLQIQDHLTKFLMYLNGKKNNFTYDSSSIIPLVEYEIKHRRQANSHLVRDQDKNNEGFVYWEGILKKYVQSVLYLNSKDKDESSKALQVFYSFAAGIAMFLSLLIGLWVSSLFEEGSASFIIALVVAYMLKDRIKAIFQAESNKLIRHLFPDRRTEIVDFKTKGVVGKVKELIRFVPSQKIPSEILNIRSSTNLSPIENEGKPEEVFLYDKKVVLLTGNIRKTHERLGDIADIIRVNIKNFIQYADDPTRDEEVWNSETKIIDTISCAKVYHLNLIFKVRSRDKGHHDNVYYKKVRVILDQKGIKRIENPTFKL
jgi:hypothetical protein